MLQITEQTHDEKIAMYMKLPKRALAEMLVYVDAVLDHRDVVSPQKSTISPCDSS